MSESELFRSDEPSYCSAYFLLNLGLPSLEGGVDPSLFEPPNNSLPLNKVPGGHQALLDGPFTLCGRSDLESDRFFTGSLSNLMMWDTGLEPVEVMRSEI
jgi:hypothetical protein